MFRIIEVVDDNPKETSCWHCVKVVLMYAKPKGGWYDPRDIYCTRRELTRYKLMEKLFSKGITQDEIDSLIEISNSIHDSDNPPPDLE